MKLLVRRPDTGYLDTSLWVPKSAINLEGVQRALTFQLFERGTTTVLTMWKETADHIVVPREFWQPSDFTFPVVDCRQQSYPQVDIKSRIQLDHRRAKDGSVVPTGDTVQREAMSALLSSRGGILQLACGKGKTVVALDWIARRGVPAIIILDTTMLVEQWAGEIALHLDVPDGVGRIQGPIFDWKKPIVLSTYHTLANISSSMPEEVRRWFGSIVWDEAHHVGAPMFSKSADIFDGMRLGLTATPKRDDGSDVIHSFHIGPIIYKNLKQAMKPRIYFKWSGFGIDTQDPYVKSQVIDSTGEVHIGKVASYFARVKARIDFTLNEVRQAVAADRRVLVVSKSVDALVNMLAVWNNYPSLMTDIPFPHQSEVGGAVPPVEMTAKDLRRSGKTLGMLRDKLAQNRSKDPVKDGMTVSYLEQKFAAHEVWKRCSRLWEKKRGEYLKKLLQVQSTAGLMIGDIKPAERMKMLREKQVNFCIAKYGREALDEKRLNTMIVNEPASRKEGVQQLLGRVLRELDGDDTERIVVFIEDDVGPFIGMCQKIRKTLREWPDDEGGRLEYENLGHPTSKGKQKQWNKRDLYQTRMTSLRGPGSS